MVPDRPLLPTTRFDARPAYPNWPQFSEWLVAATVYMSMRAASEPDALGDVLPGRVARLVRRTLHGMTRG